MTLSTVKAPTIDQLRDVAADLGMSFTDEEIAAHMAAIVDNVAAYNVVDQMSDELPAVKYPRVPGYRPMGEENKHNAWYVKTRVEGAASGKLKGKTVVLKDNICLAGVPMMNGASTLEGYVPDVDATVATRILDAGGTIVGKAVCEYFCFSGGSHTSASGPVHNPRRMGYSAGGSSSGSAALVAAGEVPMALGGDQGGSIRASMAPRANPIARRSGVAFPGCASASSRRASVIRNRWRRVTRWCARRLNASKPWASWSRRFRSRCIARAAPSGSPSPPRARRCR